MVARLRSCPDAAGEQRAGEHGVVAADDRVGGEVAVADVGADAQGAVGQALDVGEREVADVDDEAGFDDAELHVVDEVGAAGEEDGVGAVGDGGDGVGTLVARWYSKGIIGRPSGSRRRCWGTRRSDRGCRSCVLGSRRR